MNEAVVARAAGFAVVGEGGEGLGEEGCEVGLGGEGVGCGEGLGV